LQDHFVFKNDGYASIEFIMERKSFSYQPLQMTLTQKPYEPDQLDGYLELLDNAMTFVRPEPGFRRNRDAMAKKFSQHASDGSFNSFWAGEDLIGFYLRKGAEIDLLAIAAKYQRKGYGSAILQEAIKEVFAETDKEFAYLYCVDWNEKGQNFYKKYGMLPSAHSYMLARKINR
jgi:GNAT superfamily N-acetyltransferase